MRVRRGYCLTLRCLALGVASAGVRTASALPPLTDSTDVKLDFLAGEASVFVSPLDARAVLVSLATTASGSGADQTGHITTDGGQRWSNNHPTAGGGDPATAIIGNPSAYGSFGRFITLGFGPKDGQVVRYKDDPNSTWTTSTVSGDLELTDKGHLWVDNSLYSPPNRRYNLYAAWSDDGFQIDVTRSVNGGVNWLAPHHDIDHEPNTLSWGVNLQTGRTGRVYAMWSKIASTGSLAARSFGFSELESDVPFDFTDETILLEGAVHNVSSSDVGVPAGVQTTPSMAVDPGSAAGDTLFAVWADKVEGGVGPQILLMKGFADADGSPVEWDTSSLITVNQNTSTSAHQFWPWAAWDECTGSLAVDGGHRRHGEHAGRSQPGSRSELDGDSGERRGVERRRPSLGLRLHRHRRGWRARIPGMVGQSCGSGGGFAASLRVSDSARARLAEYACRELREQPGGDGHVHGNMGHEPPGVTRRQVASHLAFAQFTGVHEPGVQHVHCGWPGTYGGLRSAVRDGVLDLLGQQPADGMPWGATQCRQDGESLVLSRLAM